MNEVSAEKLLRWLLLALGVFEFATASLMVLLTDSYRRLFGVPPEVNSYYIRQIGWFLYFFVYFILLGWKDVRKNLVAVQLVIVFRGIQSLFEATHVLFLIDSRDLFYFSMAVFAFLNAAVTGILIYLLKRMGLRWIDWRRKPAA